jgi:hypothetical protein
MEHLLWQGEMAHVNPRKTSWQLPVSRGDMWHRSLAGYPLDEERVATSESQLAFPNKAALMNIL